MEEETVELIASGYEWTCPHCSEDSAIDVVQHEIEVVDFVTCDECGRDFKVDEAYHAIG